jgi:cytochrome c-type biogenesis protein
MLRAYRLAGVASAIDWTPCIGPTLAAVLAVAASGGHPAQGAVLLALYSLGLGVPFLLSGLLFTRTLGLGACPNSLRSAVWSGS